jgi:hypothetical protein
MAGRDTESDRRAQDVAALHARGDLEDRRQNRQAPNSSPCRTACAPGLTTSPASRNQQESFASTQRPADRRAASRSNQVSQHPWDRQRSRSTQGAVTLPSSLSTFCDRRCSPPGIHGGNRAPPAKTAPLSCDSIWHTKCSSASHGSRCRPRREGAPASTQRRCLGGDQECRLCSAGQDSRERTIDGKRAG